MLACQFRWVSPADQPFLWEGLYQSLYQPDPSAPLDREIVHHPDLARYVEDWGRPGDWGILARLDHQPVGVAWYRLFPAANPGYGFIDETIPELAIAVLPGYRGQGIGTQLLQRLLAEAAHHYRAISLSVSVQNPARRLYERFGFEPVRTEGTAMTLKKSLKPAGAGS